MTKLPKIMITNYPVYSLETPQQAATRNKISLEIQTAIINYNDKAKTYNMYWYKDTENGHFYKWTSKSIKAPNSHIKTVDIRNEIIDLYQEIKNLPADANWLRYTTISLNGSNPQLMYVARYKEYMTPDIQKKYDDLYNERRSLMKIALKSKKENLAKNG